MKNLMKLALGLLICTASVASAQDQKSKYFKKDNSYKTKYVRFGSSAMPIDNSYIIAPGITAGWQYTEDKKGVDISVSGFESGKKSKKAFSFFLPKVQYLSFLKNNEISNKHNAYFGLGGSVFGIFGGQKEKEYYSTFRRTKSYTGLAANASVGYNYRLGKKLQSSVLLGTSMPTPLAFHSKGDVYKPSFELNLGLGF